MHTFSAALAWLGIMLLLLIVARFIPAQEHAFRTVVALTWLLWMIVGGLYSLRYLWRFLRG